MSTTIVQQQQHTAGESIGMRSPCCNVRTRVVDSRPREGGYATYRRRECPECGTRFTTHEEISDSDFMHGFLNAGMGI